MFAQNSSDNEQVKRLQRAIYIFNFAHQVKWDNQKDYTTFKIGVLGPDRSYIDLKALAQKRTINNKQVEVINFKTVKSIDDI